MAHVPHLHLAQLKITGKSRKNPHPNDQTHPGFRWKDMKEGYNVITCAKKRGEKKLQTRNVPWIDGAEELMQRIREKLHYKDKNNENGLVFEGIGKKGIKKALRSAIQRCGLTEKLSRFSPHKIRHLFGTKCTEAGCSWKFIGECLGHDDGGILAAKLYSHLRKESSVDEAKKVSYRKKGPVRK
jgi:site-specific recombinase XerD